MINTQIHNFPGLYICLTTHGYADNRVHEKFCVDNGYYFKQDFTPLLKYLDIKPI